MIQHDTIYNNVANVAADNVPAVADFTRPAEFDFEALGEMLVRTDSVMYRQMPSKEMLTAEAQAIYGPLTESVAPREHDRTAANSPLTVSVGFQLAVIILLLLYVMLVYRFRSDIIEVFTNRKSLTEELEHSGQGSVYARFFTTTVGVGFLLLAIMIVKGADLSQQMATLDIRPWIASLAVPTVIITTAIVVVVQVALLWLIGRVAMCEYITSQLLRLRKICFSIFTISCAPAVLLYSLSEIGDANLLLYIIGFEVITLFAVFLYETYVLFAVKKISVLHWILYLCAVELFPVSLIVLTAIREF